MRGTVTSAPVISARSSIQLEEPCRQQWHIHRQKKIEWLRCLRPEPPRCRSTDRTLDADPATTGAWDDKSVRAPAIRGAATPMLRSLSSAISTRDRPPTRAEPYLAPCANSARRQAQTPQRNRPQYLPDHGLPLIPSPRTGAPFKPFFGLSGIPRLLPADCRSLSPQVRESTAKPVGRPLALSPSSSKNKMIDSIPR